jgi:hypothetical protein
MSAGGVVCRAQLNVRSARSWFAEAPFARAGLPGVADGLEEDHGDAGGGEGVYEPVVETDEVGVALVEGEAERSADGAERVDEDDVEEFLDLWAQSSGC